MNTNKERLLNYDFLRIISAISVIIIHVNWAFFRDIYLHPSFSGYWIVLSIINIITRFSVPCFLMISGAFIIEEKSNSDFTYFYKKVIKRIFLPTCIAILLFLMIEGAVCVVNRSSFLSAIKLVVKGEYCNLWYIFMLLGIYFMVPFIIRIRSTIPWKIYRSIAFIMLLWAVISQVASDYKISYSIGVCFAFLSYFLLGDVIRRESEEHTSPRIIILLVICFFCVVVSLTSRFLGFNFYTVNAYSSFFSPCVVLYSISIFVLFTYIRIKTNNELIKKISKLTFAIYISYNHNEGIIAYNIYL